MEIKLSTDSIKLARVGESSPKPVRPPAEDGGPSFPQSQAIEARLNQVPDVRPEAVERGKALVSLSQYPPIEMMHKLARLLAASSAESSQV